MDPHAPYDERPPWVEPGRTRKERRIAAYDSEIRYVDEHLAELDRLLGWQQNTLLVLLADHGEEFREHGRDWHGNTLYAEVLRVPLVFFCPARIRAGRVAGQRQHRGRAADAARVPGPAGRSRQRRPEPAGRPRGPGGLPQRDRSMRTSTVKRACGAQADELRRPRRDPGQLEARGERLGRRALRHARRSRRGHEPDRRRWTDRRRSCANSSPSWRAGSRGPRARAVALPLDRETQEKLRTLGYVD